MKHIYIILACFFANFAIAQYPVLTTTSLANPSDALLHADNGNYAVDTNNERDQYVGSWQYSNNGLFLQLKIEKVDQRFNKTALSDSYDYSDEVVIKYLLIKNGDVLFDNLNETNLEAIESYGVKRSSDPYLEGLFIEYSRGVLHHYEITRLGTSPETINFNLSRVNCHLMNPPNFYKDGQKMFNIPSMGLVLTKI